MKGFKEAVEVLDLLVDKLWIKNLDGNRYGGEQIFLH